MELIVKNFTPTSRNFLPPTGTYSPQRPGPKHKHIFSIKVFFISPTDALYIYYIKIKIYIKIHIKIAPTYFGLTIILREHIIDLC